MSASHSDSERESQLSAMFDGELPEGECELVARRLAKDENLRRSWENYSLIGAAMRSEPLAHRRLAPKIAVAVQAEPRDASAGAAEVAAAVPSRMAARISPLRWAGGVGVAAAVTAIAVFIGVNPTNQTLVADGTTEATEAVEEVIIPAAPADGAEIVLALKPTMPASVASNVDAAVASSEPESYVTPPIRDGSAPVITAPVQLANFVAAHSAVAAPMLRHSMLSTLITSAPVVDETSVDSAVAVEEAPIRGEML